MFTELSEALEVDEEMNTRGGMRGNAIELWMLKSLCGFLVPAEPMKHIWNF